MLILTKQPYWKKNENSILQNRNYTISLSHEKASIM